MFLHDLPLLSEPAILIEFSIKVRSFFSVLNFVSFAKTLDFVLYSYLGHLPSLRYLYTFFSLIMVFVYFSFCCCCFFFSNFFYTLFTHASFVKRKYFIISFFPIFFFFFCFVCKKCRGLVYIQIVRDNPECNANCVCAMITKKVTEKIWCWGGSQQKIFEGERGTRREK